MSTCREMCFSLYPIAVDLSCHATTLYVTVPGTLSLVEVYKGTLVQGIS